ncbi:Transposase [Burkholderia sp. WP9]|nr:transposase [Burkholderia sp. WP9]SED05755.1 Transposase [Burkholderia sp. WP9]
MGTRKSRPNHSDEFRHQLAVAACEPGVSVSKLAREHGINANMLFRWWRRYQAERQAETTRLIPVTVVSDVSTDIVPAASAEAAVMKSGAPTGTIEVRIGRAVIRVDGVVDAEALRTVPLSFRSGRCRSSCLQSSERHADHVAFLLGIVPCRYGAMQVEAEIQMSLEPHSRGASTNVCRGCSWLSRQIECANKSKNSRTSRLFSKSGFNFSGPCSHQRELSNRSIKSISKR